MFYAGEIEHRESVSKPIIENALRAFVDLKVVVQRDGRIGLSDGGSDADSAERLEADIALYLKEVSW